tara:strand:+ start:545 stop:763 length:219 start_codon:yes stop_codon:yes gene_type:complete
MEDGNFSYTVELPLKVSYDAAHGLVNFEYCNSKTRKTAKSMGASIEDGYVKLTQSMIDEELKRIEQYLSELN